MSTIFSNNSIGNSFTGQNPPRKRETFLDYFPNVCAHYVGYIREATFKNKMEQIIKESVDTVGPFTGKYWTEPTSNTGWSQKGIAMQRESARNGYIQDIKNQILASINMEEWRPMQKMNTSDDMYAQSDAYFHKAGKDVTVAVASAGVGKAFGKVMTKFSGQTVNKLIKPGTKLNSIIGKTLGKEYKIGTGIFTAKFQGVDQLMGKSVEGAVGLGDQLLTSKKVKQYEGFDPDYFGDNWLGNSVDFVANLSPITKIEKKIFGKNIARNSADFGTDLIPVVSWCKTGVTTLGNIVLGAQMYYKATKLKEDNDQNNETERAYNANLTQTIYDDMNFLSFEDTEALIRLCGMGELIK